MTNYAIDHITQDSGPLGIERGYYVRVNGVLVGPRCATFEEAEKKLRERHDRAFRFCAEIFRATRGVPMAWREIGDIANRAAINGEDVRTIVSEAEAEGLLIRGAGTNVALTEAGRKAVG